MIKSLLSLIDKIKNRYYIFQKIIYLRKIKPKYLFYSESRSYQKYAYLLIEALLEKYPQEIYYVSSEIDDEIKTLDVKNIFISKGLMLNVFFAIVRVENMFLTLTDLGNHVVSKTKNVDKYIYYFHAPVSTIKKYTATAFDNYDVILCNGDYHIAEIKKREEIKKINKKELIKTGYFYFDYLNNRINRKVEANEILIAPSWNYNNKNFINENLEEIIQSVLNGGHIVRFRPHPESFKRSMLTITSLLKKFSNKNFILDESSENINSMEKAKCLISDNSGIAIEFVLLFKRPTLYFEDVDKIHNIEFNNYKDLITMDQKVKDTFGYTFKRDDIKYLDALIAKSIIEFKDKDTEIRNFIDNNFYNYGVTVEKFKDLTNKGF